jgi:hypothetical protein
VPADGDHQSCYPILKLRWRSDDIECTVIARSCAKETERLSRLRGWFGCSAYRSLVGLTAQVSRETNVERNILPSMAAEDFARFLEEKPKTYIWAQSRTGENTTVPAQRSQ